MNQTGEVTGPGSRQPFHCLPKPPPVGLHAAHLARQQLPSGHKGSGFQALALGVLCFSPTVYRASDGTNTTRFPSPLKTHATLTASLGHPTAQEQLSHWVSCVSICRGFLLLLLVLIKKSQSLNSDSLLQICMQKKFFFPGKIIAIWFLVCKDWVEWVAPDCGCGTNN